MSRIWVLVMKTKSTNNENTRPDNVNELTIAYQHCDAALAVRVRYRRELRARLIELRLQPRALAAAARAGLKSLLRPCLHRRERAPCSREIGLCVLGAAREQRHFGAEL